NVGTRFIASALLCVYALRIKERYTNMAEAVIVSAVRTPIGRANKGVLKDVRADDLAALAVRAAVERVLRLDRALIEDVILGCAFPEGEQGMNLARLVGALAGLPETAGGVTVNRFCASSLQAVNMAAKHRMPLRCVVTSGRLQRPITASSNARSSQYRCPMVHLWKSTKVRAATH